MTQDTQGRDGASPKEYRVNVLDRAVMILKAFSANEPKLALSEISKRTGIHVSTCLRLLSTLRHHGLVSRDELSGSYRLGYEIIALAETARSGGGLVEAALPIMRELSEQFDETVVLSVRSGSERVDLEQVVGRQTVRRVVELGVPRPLYAGAASRTLLAGMSDAEVDAYLEKVPLRRLAEHTITDAEALRKTLATIRKKGFAISVQEQSDGGGAGVAVPIRGARNEMVGVIGVSVPQFRFTPSLRAQLVPAVMGAAAKISRMIGGSGRQTA